MESAPEMPPPPPLPSPSPTHSSSNKSKASWASFVAPSGSSREGDTTTARSVVRTNIKEIERIVGFVSDQYDCVHNNFAGTLYSGPLAVVWLGRIFFFEWTVVIKWEDVAQVQKQSDGVRISVTTPKAGNHEFEKIFNPERAWANLVSLHNDTILDRPRRSPTPRQMTRSLRRMNSDPLRMSMVFDFDEPSPMIEAISPATKRESLLQIKRQSQLERTVSAPMRKDSDTLKPSISHSSMESTPSASSSVRATLEQQWSTIMEDSAAYSEIAIDKLELPCDLDAFFYMFVSDVAKYSLPCYMKENRDEEIQSSPWTKDADGVQSRTIEYTHPVNAPMAPPRARARKEQSYRKFGKQGLVLQTRTYVSDVPMTDCFFVADQILVEPLEGKVSITMSFDIKFVKSTMFKAIIARTTKGEFESFMQRLASFMSKSLGDEATSAPVLPRMAVPALPPPVTVPIRSNLIIALLVGVLLLQGWTILDMRAFKSDLHHLQSSISGECPVQ